MVSGIIFITVNVQFIFDNLTYTKHFEDIKLYYYYDLHSNKRRL